MLFSSSKMLLSNKARERQNVHNWKEHDCEAPKFERIFVRVLVVCSQPQCWKLTKARMTASRSQPSFPRLCLRLEVIFRLRVWDPGKFTGFCPSLFPNIRVLIK